MILNSKLCLKWSYGKERIAVFKDGKIKGVEITQIRTWLSFYIALATDFNMKYKFKGGITTGDSNTWSSE